MGRWERSKHLVSASWSVLRQDKELMVLPLIASIAWIITAATFLVPVFLTSRHTDASGHDTTSLGPLQFVMGFLMYVALAYVTIFFRTAILCGADERMRGGSPSLSSALAGAGRHAGRILPWAVVSATVSIILRGLEERAGLLGRIVIGIVGVAWAVVTFLVLPILVFEDIGIGQAIKRSTELLKRTWGENLIVNTGIGLVGFVLCLPAFVVMAGGFATGVAAVAIGGLVVGVLWLIGVTCWTNAMSGIFQLALYRYATDGVAPSAFATADLAGSFQPKGRARRFLG